MSKKWEKVPSSTFHDWAISDEKETFTYSGITYRTRTCDGVTGDVFLNVLVCCSTDNTHRKSFILNSNVRFFTLKNHASLFRYANASIQNTSMPSLDAKATCIFSILRFKMSGLYEETIPCVWVWVWEDQTWSTLLLKMKFLINPSEHSRNSDTKEFCIFLPQSVYVFSLIFTMKYCYLFNMRNWLVFIM
jgi:hypothetical protein